MGHFHSSIHTGLAHTVAKSQLREHTPESEEAGSAPNLLRASRSLRTASYTYHSFES